MKIIIVSKQHGQTRSITLGGWTRALLSICLLGMPVTAAGVLGTQWLNSLSGNGDVFTAESRRAWEATLAEQQEQVKETREHARSQVAALTLRVAELQARLMRLDALGEHLTGMANLDEV